MTTERSHPITDGYAALLGLLCDYDRMVDLGAPPILLHEKAKDAQLAFDRLLSSVSSPVNLREIDGWGIRLPASAKRAVPLSWQGDAANTAGNDDDDDEATPPSCLWLDEHTIAVQWDGTAYIYNVCSGTLVRQLPIGPPRLQACSDNGRFVMVTSDSPFFGTDGAHEGFGCFDAETGIWLETLPADLPPVTFGKYDPEDGALFELSRGQSIAVQGGDRPTALCFSRGNRFVLESGDFEALVGGCIRSTESALISLDSEALDHECWDCPILSHDGTLLEPNEELREEVEEAMADRWDERHFVPHPAAIVEHATDGWRMLLPGLAIASRDTDLFALGFAIEAASFRPDGERLLVVTPTEMIIIDIEGRRIVWRAPGHGTGSGTIERSAEPR